MNRESQNLEWKESCKDDHLRGVCGFANALGGTLVIGRNDKGRNVGLKHARKLLEDLPNKIRDLLGIIVEVNLVTAGSQETLEIIADPNARPISYRRHYYQRSGNTLRKLKSRPGASCDGLTPYMRSGVGKRKGFRIRSIIDCSIAATAIETGASILQKDRDFEFMAVDYPIITEKE